MLSAQPKRGTCCTLMAPYMGRGRTRGTDRMVGEGAEALSSLLEGVSWPRLTRVMLAAERSELLEDQGAKLGEEGFLTAVAGATTGSRKSRPLTMSVRSTRRSSCSQMASQLPG